MKHPLLALCVIMALPCCRTKPSAPPAPPPDPVTSPSTVDAHEPTPATPSPATAREMVDTVGYCTTADQMRSVVEAARELEAKRLADTAKKVSGIAPYAALCPHDDHLYAARVYLHSIPYVAQAETVIVFGVTHKAAREALGDPQDRIILDDFEDWISATGHVPVDQSLRSAIADGMGKDDIMVSRMAHEKEHSIEGLISWLQYFNPDVRIVPIMVTSMGQESMERISASLAGVIVDHARANDLVLGKDLSVLISVDAVHYGPDFDHSPFGTDQKGHDAAVARDTTIGETHLGGPTSITSIRGFTDEVWGDEITWCGRYSVPFGLLTTARVATALTGGPPIGVPLRYGDSHTLHALPSPPEGLGTTAPESLTHWVGYWAIVYGEEVATTTGHTSTTSS